jgi:hypothetical protein
MARYAIAGVSTIAGTTVRGQFSLYAIANIVAKVREVGLCNTTVTAYFTALARFTNATGVGAGLTEAEYDENSPAPSCTGFAGHTADSATGQIFRRYTIGAAMGSSVIWTFGDTGLVIAAGTANGIGPIIPSGTGQIADYHLDWDE